MVRAPRARMSLWAYWFRSRQQWEAAGSPPLPPSTSGIGVQQQLTQSIPPANTDHTTTPDMGDYHTDGEEDAMADGDADDYDSYQDHYPVWENAGSGTEFEGDGLEMMEAGSSSDNENAYYSQEEENSTGVVDQGTINHDDFFGGSHFTPINAQPAHLLDSPPPL